MHSKIFILLQLANLFKVHNLKIESIVYVLLNISKGYFFRAGQFKLKTNIRNFVHVNKESSVYPFVIKL